MPGYSPEHLKDISKFFLAHNKPYWVNILYPNVIRMNEEGVLYAFTRNGEDPDYIEVVWGPSSPIGRGI